MGVEDLSKGVEDLNKGVEDLEKKQVIADYFYLSPVGSVVPQEYCYDSVPVQAGQTVDFSANMSTPWSNASGSSHFHLIMHKNMERVAVSNTNEADDYEFDIFEFDNIGEGTNNSASLLYREKLTEYAEFRLCV